MCDWIAMSPAPPSVARVVCIFGTGSDVGKSWIAAGLCRMLTNKGIRVAPFKAQNMSNNAGVTPLGLEMGRAQIVQAHACKRTAHVDMNPILLKPNTDTGAQVVVLGRPIGTVEAADYFSGDMKSRHAIVRDALDRLRTQADVVVVEGAGSCAEVNLRHLDLVNMPVAQYADAPVILVADIAKGGVFAQVVGTLAVMPPEDRARVAGIIINRFRGDESLFDGGRRWLEERTGLPILGVVPWAWDIHIDQEDGFSPETQLDPDPPTDRAIMSVAVIRLPHISNFTDLNNLERHGCRVDYLSIPRDLSPYDAVLLPGTKNTRGDLAWMQEQGWVQAIQAYTGTIIGLCGGFQMLGSSINDPDGIEGEPGTSLGLRYVEMDTVMHASKVTQEVRGFVGGTAVYGYEIHCGRSTQTATYPPLVVLDSGGTEGIRLPKLIGTYIHGIFDAPGAVAAILGTVRPDLSWPELTSHQEHQHVQFDRLAAHLETALNEDALMRIVNLPATAPEEHERE